MLLTLQVYHESYYLKYFSFTFFFLDEISFGALYASNAMDGRLLTLSNIDDLSTQVYCILFIFNSL
jgi:hypothetical protein